MSGGTEQIGREEARRIALAAQWLDRPRPGAPAGAAQIRELIRHLGVLQLDSVNVLSRAHYLPIFSRLGGYDRAVLDRMAAHSGGAGAAGDAGGVGDAGAAADAGAASGAGAGGAAGAKPELFEYWAHMASLLPLELYPLMRWRMERADRDAWKGVRTLAGERPELIVATLALVEGQGPLTAREVEHEPRQRRPGSMWNWHEGKIALEYLFYAGQVVASQRVNFERLYDLPERVLPAATLSAPVPDEAEAQRALLRIAAAALGVATEPDLGDYYRLSRADSRARVAELVAAGELLPVEVEGWRAPAYLWPAAARPAAVGARALLSPFDSLIWTRERVARLFEFEYRIEIYVPAPKRRYGYYVLPFLLGERLVARVDLKSDRVASTLVVQAAHLEPGADAELVSPELAAELGQLAAWLELGKVSVRRRGNLARALAAALRGAPDPGKTRPARPQGAGPKLR